MVKSAVLATSAWRSCRTQRQLVQSPSDHCDQWKITYGVPGPFGGAVAFTQSATAKKRAVEYNLRKRRFARWLEKETLTIEELQELAEESDEK